MTEKISERILYIDKILEKPGFQEIQEIGAGKGWIDIEHNTGDSNYDRKTL
jgi:hypothetical protein